jgi:hypothetical protein
MKDKIGPKAFRWMLNLWPCYRGTGGWVTFIANDWREMRVKLALGWLTRNYVGTLFGGSLFGAMDPMYMIMLIHLLGPEYVVWDKAATIRFIKPGRDTLYATFRVEDAELAEIQGLLFNQPKIERSYTIALADAAGVVCAEVVKVIQIRKKAGEGAGRIK